MKLIENQENVGFAAANNQGFDVVQGKYILILNPDTILEKGSLDHLVVKMDDSMSVGAITAKITWPDGSIQRSCARKGPDLWNLICDSWGFAHIFPNVWVFSGTQLPYAAYKQRQEVEVMSGAFMLVRRDVLEMLEGFDERYFFGNEDVDLCKRIGDAGWKLIFDPSVQVIHIGGQSQAQVRSRIRREILQGTTWYFQSHHPKIPVVAVHFVLWIHLVLKIGESVMANILTRNSFSKEIKEDFNTLGWWTRTFLSKCYE